MNNIVAIIIARGGSKRLLRKNVLPFAGKPLVEWSIIQARAARCLTDHDIYLSTDDAEIAAIGRRCGIRVIRRPDWPNADELSASAPISHALEVIQKHRAPTLFFSLLPTSVCRLPGDLDRVLEHYRIMKPGHEDCYFAAMLTPQRETVIYERYNDAMRCVLFDKHFRYYGLGPSAGLTEVSDFLRRDAAAPGSHTDAEADAAVAGAEGVAADVIRNSIFRNSYCITGKWYQAFDIDDAETFALNEILFKQFILRGRGEEIYWSYKAGGEDDRVDTDEQEAAERREVL